MSNERGNERIDSGRYNTYFGNDPNATIVHHNSPPLYKYVNGKWVETILGIPIYGDITKAPPAPSVVGQLVCLGYDQVREIWHAAIRTNAIGLNNDPNNDGVIHLRWVGSQWA